MSCRLVFSCTLVAICPVCHSCLWALHSVRAATFVVRVSSAPARLALCIVYAVTFACVHLARVLFLVVLFF